MRAPKRIEQKKIQEVASLLIPLQAQSILLANDSGGNYSIISRAAHRKCTLVVFG